MRKKNPALGRKKKQKAARKRRFHDEALETRTPPFQQNTPLLVQAEKKKRAEVEGEKELRAARGGDGKINRLS